MTLQFGGTIRSQLTSRALSIMLVAVFLTWAAIALAAPQVIGIASAVVNEVAIKPASVSSFQPAKLRQRVALADRVRTGPQSRMQLLLLDKTKFTVGANALLTIDRFVYDPNGGSLSASVAKGAFRFMSGSSRNATKTVTTPSATIGIRGTVFDAAVGEQAVDIARRERAVPQDTRHDPATATLVVLRGPGPNRQAGLPVGLVDVIAAGQTVTLDAPLLAAYVPYAGAVPIGPFPISLSGLGQLSDFILPPPERDLKPFTPADLPFRRDEPRGPPPYIVGPGGEGPGPRPGFGNDGYIPDVGGFPRPMDQPGMTHQPTPGTNAAGTPNPVTTNPTTSITATNNQNPNNPGTTAQPTPQPSPSP